MEKDIHPRLSHSLLSGLLRHMGEMKFNCPNFLEKSDSNFEDLHGTLDSLFHQLHSDGIGRQVKHARGREKTLGCWRYGYKKPQSSGVFNRDFA